MPTGFEDVKAGGSSTASTPIPETTELQLGETYRMRLTLTGPYDSTTPGKIKNVINAGVGLNNDLASKHFVLHNIVRIDRIDVGNVNNDSRLFRFPTFTVDVTFTKTGAGTPILLIAGILIVLILASLGMLFLVTNRQMFHEARATLGGDLPALAGSLVAPVLAVALLIFFLKKR